MTKVNDPTSGGMNLKFGFFGAGQMAQALAAGMVRGNVAAPADIIAFDPSESAANAFAVKTRGAKIATSNREVARLSSILIVAVKPQLVPTLASEVAPLPDDKLLISIAAGVSLTKLNEWFGTTRTIRVMPNTPCLVGEGASVYCAGLTARDDDRKIADRIFGATGTVRELPERYLDAVTGLSGSGPAFLFLVIEALADGGVRAGLPRDVALALAAQTTLGAAKMTLEGEHPAVLKDRVASPGGTTIAGLHVLEDRGVRGAFISAIQAATDRSRELGG